MAAPLQLSLIWCQCGARGWRGWATPLSGGAGVLPPWYPPHCPSSPHLLLSLLMINQFHRPLRSVVSCYLATSCHDLPGPLVFPWWQCAHPVISLAAPSWWPVATPGPDPQLPSSLPHGPIRLSVCVHVALPPHAMSDPSATSGRSSPSLLSEHAPSPRY